ncbi:MYND-type zinc finger protein MUB1 [Aspergillus clavatus NRRL 1]|uniref:MYND-type zinc finger protein samB n=1 Tax=Aspergillus clavatus (strain ATCC 1007 / CBS 513.65 / DSM 816 / NCTC 3887 / NRRL 1 / QM 1276 / 107) TaxID=344612 RepID=MUB1_ASPCL|nr:MYND domain protein (SamB), putative [Aspergillus clavatus NRRL 1]A1CBG9.1 RecName: Full=MYND-type zinc finger protein samB; AltName: Full=Suppressor of anucleate metulae protein B [Aspergillus clavatus NRRL 1]EAW13087.1 MYND domain protein (SamB), putative [Aspergillus clavatus NRRL 1]
MREVNFSIPNVNKASVNITTTLYDRRALDCTSTLPLINSLNHLAYLTTSSARIRDILTVDGGIERLVCILKEGRSGDLMEMWKWSLAFQCVVNIGVRGSESVRTRVVEADMVPVIATILDNYIKVVDKARARADSESHKQSSRHHPKSVPAPSDSSGRPAFLEQSSASENRTSRRQAPPPSIEIPPQPLFIDVTSPPRVPMTSPPERSTFGQDVHNHRTNDTRYAHPSHRHRTMQPLATALPPMDTADGFGLRPVRDNERLPSMLPALHTGLTSQPDSPTTPNAPVQPRSIAQATHARHRPSLRQQLSASGESDDGNGESSTMEDESTPAETAEPIVGLQNRMDIDDVGNREAIIGGVSESHDLTVTDPSEGQEAETFNITHRSTVDGSMINTDNAQNNAALGLSPAQAADTATSPALVPSPYSLYFRDRSTAAAQGVLTTMPRDEDVLMSLQLLAYVSKYCNLRSYFQNSHFVPKLKIDRELQMLEEGTSPIEPAEEEDEYLLPDDVNIFPLVEKFTVRHHSKDMQYWACVVMRNLCRKDEARGGIRQCAYYKCGKWEETARQFAKCRRCRRTKYCSKDCQKAAWVYHRHWCHSTP